MEWKLRSLQRMEAPEVTLISCHHQTTRFEGTRRWDVFEEESVVGGEEVPHSIPDTAVEVVALRLAVR